MHGDKLDVESNLWSLARRLVPLYVIKDKLDAYIAEGHIASHEKDQYAQVFEEMLGAHRESNLHAAPEGDGGSATTAEPDEESGKWPKQNSNASWKFENARCNHSMGKVAS